MGLLCMSNSGPSVNPVPLYCKSVRGCSRQALAPAAFAGVLGGYLAYDCVHYCLHHGRGRRGWLGALRGAHLAHHFRAPHAGFGISSVLFDALLATRIK